MELEPKARRGGLELRVLGTRDGRRYVAKKLHPALRREVQAYSGFLRSTGLAPGFIGVHREGADRWLVLEHGGAQISRTDTARHLPALAALAGRVHGLSHRWPRLRLPFPRPVHVNYGARHLRGEWRIATERLQAAIKAGWADSSVLGTESQRRHVLQQAEEALRAQAPVLLHGDFQGQNVLVGREGTLRLVDWSAWGRGPALLDLTSLTLDLKTDELREFCARYTTAQGGESASEMAEKALQIRPLRHFLGLGVLARRAVLDRTSIHTYANTPARLTWNRL